MGSEMCIRDRRPREILLQRTIVILMRKASDPHPEKRDPESNDFKDIREQLYLMRLTRLNEVIEAKKKVAEDIKNEIDGRVFETWYPIITIAYLCGEDVYAKVKEYVIEDNISLSPFAFVILEMKIFYIFLILEEVPLEVH